MASGSNRSKIAVAVLYGRKISSRVVTVIPCLSRSRRLDGHRRGDGGNDDRRNGNDGDRLHKHHFRHKKRMGVNRLVIEMPDTVGIPPPAAMTIETGLVPPSGQPKPALSTVEMGKITMREGTMIPSQMVPRVRPMPRRRVPRRRTRMSGSHARMSGGTSRRR